MSSMPNRLRRRSQGRLNCISRQRAATAYQCDEWNYARTGEAFVRARRLAVSKRILALQADEQPDNQGYAKPIQQRTIIHIIHNRLEGPFRAVGANTFTA